jgi:predicted DNA binding protein
MGERLIHPGDEGPESMGTGIRAEVTVDAAGTCPITEVARETETATLSITKSVNPDGSGRVTEEFLIDADDELPASITENMRVVFTYGSKHVLQFDRDLDSECPCSSVERFDAPVVDVHTREGLLHLVFHARDMDHLRDVIDQLREDYPTVRIERLLRSSDEDPVRSLVFVDRAKLTDRQREVLETAHEMGYFDRPKGANAEEVAAELGIAPSTFAEHVAAAQSKLFDTILDD